MARWARSPLDAALVLVATARELGHDPDRLTPRGALESWVAAAQVPFRVPAAPDADALFYGFDTRDGAFRLDLVRRFARRDGQGHSEVRSGVRLPSTHELEDLGGHAQWCYEPPASQGRHAWTAALGARPEWALLDGVADAEVVLVATPS